MIEASFEPSTCAETERITNENAAFYTENVFRKDDYINLINTQRNINHESNLFG